jgi:cytochrome c-type biogenesis protein CcmE
MNKKTMLYLAGGALIVAFIFFSVMSFSDTLTPYVTFEQARSMGRTVQVAGGLVKGSSSYQDAEGALYFTLEEPETKATLRVRYHGLRPANFEDAISIVAIGRYDDDAVEMRADKLLVKCPSKYQGAEVKTYG